MLATSKTGEPQWPRQLLLVRHGESAGNVARDAAEAAGNVRIEIELRDMDVPLSDRGMDQARALGAWLAQLGDQGPAVVISSPYRRAAQTAEVAFESSDLATPLVLDERLRERDFGMLDRLTRRGILEQFPEQAEARKRVGKFYYRPPGGESWCDVALRVRSALDTISREHPGERVLVVAHEVTILMFRYVLEQLTEAEVLAIGNETPMINCSVTTYTFDLGPPPGMLLQSYNTVSALETEDAPVTREPNVSASAEIRPLDPDGLRTHAVERPSDDSTRSKHDRGRVLVVGGSRETPGAVRLAADAAMRVGVGVVQIATAASAISALGVALPETRVVPLAEREPQGTLQDLAGRLPELAAGVDAVLVGSGTLDVESTACLVEAVTAGLSTTSTMVLDAAALDAVARDRRMLDDVADRAVLMPNLGEAARILDVAESEVARDLGGALERIVETFDSVVAVRGPETWISAPGELRFRCCDGHQLLGVAGSGDVLAGALVGFAARGFKPLDAAKLAVAVHARAGEHLARRGPGLGHPARELLEPLAGLTEAIAMRGRSAS